VTPVKRYSWEDDDSVPEWFPEKEPPLSDSSRDVSGVQNPTEKLPPRNNATDRDPE
jgi:hypothetical protein